MKKLVIILTVMLALIAGPLAAENEIIETYVSPGSYQLTAEIDSNGDTLVRVEGNVDYLFGYMLLSMLDSHKPVYLELSSMGGRIDEIKMAGDYIAANGIEVRVQKGDYRVSACAFLALYSPNIVIEGQVAFHLPYYEGYAKDTTLATISHESFEISIRQTRMLFDHNWAMFLYYVIYAATPEPNTFIVFTDTESLANFRIDSKEEFTSHVADPETEYMVINSFQINDIAILQQNE